MQDLLDKVDRWFSTVHGTSDPFRKFPEGLEEIELENLEDLRFVVEVCYARANDLECVFLSDLGDPTARLVDVNIYEFLKSQCRLTWTDLQAVIEQIFIEFVKRTEGRENYFAHTDVLAAMQTMKQAWDLEVTA